MINLQLERIFLIQEYLYLKQKYIFLGSHKESHNFFFMFFQVIKCDDAKCCSPFRSDLRSILQSGFLPPPLLIKQDSALERLVAAAPMENINSAKFLSLFQRLAIKIPIPGEADMKMVPYDFYCPTYKKILKEGYAQYAGSISVQRKTKYCTENPCILWSINHARKNLRA